MAVCIHSILLIVFYFFVGYHLLPYEVYHNFFYVIGGLAFPLVFSAMLNAVHHSVLERPVKYAVYGGMASTFIFLFVFSCGQKTPVCELTKPVELPISTSDCSGVQPEELISKLRTAGFLNIEATVGWGYTPDHDAVSIVAVDGHTYFQKGNEYQANTPIVITYQSKHKTHNWQGATCTSAKHCPTCGATDGDPLGHEHLDNNWTVAVSPTCQTEGKEKNLCTRCGEVASRTIPVIGHVAGEWQIAQEATPDAPGYRVKSCTMCGIELAREEYALPTPTPTPKAAQSSKSSGSSGTQSSSSSKSKSGNQSNSGKKSGSSNGGSGNGNNFNKYDNANQQKTSARYVLNKNTRKFHIPSCRDVRKIAPKNYATSNQTRDALLSSGYKACKHCYP